MGSPSLPDDINRGRVESLEGGIVLMVSKIRNVAAPKVKEESGAAPRMLKISLTDGSTTCHAVEMSELKSVSLKTPLGTKIRLKGGVLEVANGFVKISEKNLEVIGGEVEALVERWKVNQSLAEFTRSGMTGDGGQGPPKWLPFGQKNKMPKQDPNTKNFKSIVAKSSEAGEDGEFERARQEAVQEAAKGEQKKFGAGSKNIKESRAKRDEDRALARREEREKSHSVENTEMFVRDNFEAADRGGDRGERGGRGRGGRGRGRGRREREEEDSGQAAPSQPSLFDFLAASVPVSAPTSTSTARLESKESEKGKPRLEDNGRSDTKGRGERDRPKTGKDRDRDRDREWSNRKDNQDKRSQGDFKLKDEGRKKENSSENADRKNHRKETKNSQSQRSSNQSKDFKPIFHGRTNGSEGPDKLDKYERSLFAESSGRNQSAKSHSQQRENSGRDSSKQSSYNTHNYPPLGGKQSGGNDQDFGQWNGHSGPRHQQEDLGAAFQNLSLGPSANRGGFQPNRGGRNGHYQQDRYNGGGGGGAGGGSGGGGGGGGGGGYQRHSEQRPNPGHQERRGEQGGAARQTWQKGAKCRAKYWEVRIMIMIKLISHQ